MYGKKTWLIPDGYIPSTSSGSFVSHEAICVLNLSENDAKINISIYFENDEPMEGFFAECGKKRTNHIRLDKITDKNGKKIPVDMPYAMKVESDTPIVVQHSRMDTSQAELTLMSTMAFPLD